MKKKPEKDVKKEKEKEKEKEKAKSDSGKEEEKKSKKDKEKKKDSEAADTKKEKNVWLDHLIGWENTDTFYSTRGIFCICAYHDSYF